MYTLQLKDSNEKFYVVAIKHIMIIKLCCILGVKGTASSSNNTIEVERVLGIEAARYVLIFINFSRLKCPDMMVIFGANNRFESPFIETRKECEQNLLIIDISFLSFLFQRTYIHDRHSRNLIYIVRECLSCV